MRKEFFGFRLCLKLRKALNAAAKKQKISTGKLIYDTLAAKFL